MNLFVLVLENVKICLSNQGKTAKRSLCLKPHVFIIEKTSAETFYVSSELPRVAHIGSVYLKS